MRSPPANSARLDQGAVIKTHRDGFPWFSARRVRRRDVCASQDGRNDVRKPRKAAVPVVSAHPRSASGNLTDAQASLAASFLPGNKRTRSLWVFIIAPWLSNSGTVVKLFLNPFCPLPGTRLSPKSSPAARPARFIIVPLCLRPPKVLDAMADSCPSCNQRGGIALAIVPAGDEGSALGCGTVCRFSPVTPSPPFVASGRPRR